MPETPTKYGMEALNSIEIPADTQAFTFEDFANIRQPAARGGEKRVFIADVVGAEKSATIKLPRRNRLRRTAQEIHKSTKQTNQTMLEADTIGKGVEEMTIADVQETLRTPEFKEEYNARVIKSIQRAQRLAKKSSMIPVPLGVYKTRSGLLGEVYTAYEGQMAQNFSDPKQSKPLTDEQWQYYQEQVRVINDAFLLPPSNDALQLNNVIVIGDGREDIMFAEIPEYTF